MTYAQPMCSLWIKRDGCNPLKDIHRFNPRLKGCFTGGFEAIFSLHINDLMYFSTKSGPTTTT
jgi:hypothetical protein